MTLLILKTYFYVLLFIAGGAFLILFGGLYLVLREKRQLPINIPSPEINLDETNETQASKKISKVSITSQDFNAISGDEDVIATQLDLARAYIESGRQSLAKKILLHVVQNGKAEQQREAELLLLQLEEISN